MLSDLDIVVDALSAEFRFCRLPKFLNVSLDGIANLSITLVALSEFELVCTFVVVDPRFCLLLVGMHVSTGGSVLLSTGDSGADSSGISIFELAVSLFLHGFELVEGLQVGFQALGAGAIRVPDV